MNAKQIKKLLKDIAFDGYAFRVITKYTAEVGDDEFIDAPEECNFLQAFYTEPDIHTGEPTTQYTRKWYISPHATAGEIVQTAFKCLLTSMEHRVREHFTYKGKRILSPHFGLDFLVKCCAESQEYRER